MLRQNTSALSSGIDIVLDFFLRLEFETLFFAEGRFFCTFEDDFVFFCLGLDFNIIKKRNCRNKFYSFYNNDKHFSCL